MNFLKSFIENTKTDNKVTLNDSSYNFPLLNLFWRALKIFNYLQHTVLVSKPPAEFPTYQDSQRFVCCSASVPAFPGLGWGVGGGEDLL